MNSMETGYETRYFLESIKKVTSRRYNYPQENELVAVKGHYVYPETVAGFFRSMVLDERHLRVLLSVNELRLADITMLKRKTNYSFKVIKTLTDDCVTHGLLCENHVMFKESGELRWYIVDSGGIFALAESGTEYKKLAYTTTLKERYNIYRENLFYVYNPGERGVKLIFLENMENPDDVQRYAYGKLVILFNTRILESLGLVDFAKDFIKKASKIKEIKAYDLRMNIFQQGA